MLVEEWADLLEGRSNCVDLESFHTNAWQDNGRNNYQISRLHVQQTSPEEVKPKKIILIGFFP